MVRHIYTFTQANKACGGFCIGGITLVGIGFNDYAFIHQRMMAWLVSVGIIRIVSVRHVCADKKTVS